MQEKYLSLVYDVMPCWYQLSFDSVNLALIIKLHRDVIQFLPSVTEDCPLVKMWMKEFEFKEVSLCFDQELFGFEEAFKRIGDEGSFIVFSIKIPVLEQFFMQRCVYCQGNKKDLLFGGDCVVCDATGEQKKTKDCFFCDGGKNSDSEDCFRCHGTGKEFESWMDWHSFYAISASLSLFFDLMSFGQNEKAAVLCDFPQLILVQTGTQKGSHGGSLNGAYGISLASWLQTFEENTHLLEARDAMHRVHNHIYQRSDDIDKMNTFARIQKDGWLSISCPGDRTGLFPSSHFSIRAGLGYEFACHNVDTPMQQLTLLVGLAVIHDMAKRSIA